MAKKTVLIVFPTVWDARQLQSCRADWEGDYEIHMATPAAEDCPYDLEIAGYIDRIIDTWRGRIDGVMSSSDYPGATVAGTVATELGLPGCAPETLIRASHKYYSRLSQQQSVPEATPWFALVDPDAPDRVGDVEYPVFIKPVKGAFSVHSGKIHSSEELRAFLARPVIREFTTGYLAVFNRLVAERTSLEHDGRYFLLEDFMHGVQVTVEGFVADGAVQVYGVVDSVMFQEFGSFARFDYPSALRREIQDLIRETASRAVAGLGLNNCHYNIEMIYDASDDSVRIIEINPRLCGQFGDLYQKVDGQNSYVMALAVATGTRPAVTAGAGKYSMATSFPLRLFRPATVGRAPDAATVRHVEEKHGDTLVWVECEGGQQLDDFHTWEDGHSFRYGVVNTGGNSRRELRDRLAAVLGDLDFRFDPA